MSVSISAVIITFQRDLDLIDAVNSCSAALGSHLSEIIVVDNNNDGSDRNLLFIENKLVKLINPKCNLGVSAGRNLGAANANSEFLLFFDDDAIFSDLFCLDYFVSRLREDTMLASNVIRKNGKYAAEEFPFFFKKRDRKRLAMTTRFIGVAHTCSKKMFSEFGGYDENSIYGMEEFHFSAWILSRKYNIEYCPAFNVIHKKSNSGREQWKKQILMMYKNKLIFISTWYFQPLTFLLCFINFLYFYKAGVDFKVGVNLAMRYAIFNQQTTKPSFTEKFRFLICQFRAKEPLI